MQVEDVMTRDVVSIDSDENIYEACKIFSKFHVGCLVVMKNEIIVGIITERDTINRLILKNKNPNDTKVRDIMTPNIKTIHALAPLEKAATIMKENKIKKLPVVLNNEIVGIITETDLTRTINTFTENVEELTNFYLKSKESIDNIMHEWGNILYSLNGYRKETDEEDNLIIEKKVD
jgi:CBS domain-containing protein